MGLYSSYVLPRLTHLSMGQAELKPYRQRVAGGARGRILEMGIGSGPNLACYGDAVEEIIGIDSSPGMLALAERAIADSRHKVTLLSGSAESVPLEAGSIDTVVFTWSLCSIPHPVAALREARRVLKRDGELRFVEHGLSPDAAVRRWQDWLTPLWRRCVGGCHLNRKTDDLVWAGGFNITNLSAGYARGLQQMLYMYEGQARP
jgi:ubiquinone/menaquinone biosynthesis C-methylase UbiE